MEDFTFYGSMFLIGAALAASGVTGVLLPAGNRAGVVLALLAGAGVGIAGLALGSPAFGDDDANAMWRVFFLSSIAGSVTVVLCLVLAWRRARPDPAQVPDAISLRLRSRSRNGVGTTVAATLPRSPSTLHSTDRRVPGCSNRLSTEPNPTIFLIVGPHVMLVARPTCLPSL